MRPCTAGGKRVAYTLVELLLAVAICSVVAVTVLMMLDSIIAATGTQLDTRRANVRRQVAAERLGAQTRGAAMYLARGDAHLVLWTGDTRRNGLPDLSELRRIEWDAASGSVRSYEAPETLDGALDVMYGLDSDFSAITASAAGGASLPGRTLLGDVTAWELLLDDDDAQAARLLRLRVTIQSESGPETATIVSGLRLGSP
jgi:type II secretory pathway component PulJ